MRKNIDGEMILVFVMEIIICGTQFKKDESELLTDAMA